MVDCRSRGLTMTRRVVVSGAGLLLMGANAWASSDFEDFIEQMRLAARASGISEETIASVLTMTQPNQHVLTLNDHQPEFSLTWTEYKAMVLPLSRLRQAASVSVERAALLSRVKEDLSVDPNVIIGIWGLESDFGRKQGDYAVFESLATLAFGSHRHRFFRNELLSALTITDRRGVAAEAMRGSWAGAMGQPQFMPSAYLRFARAMNGGTDADIWRNDADVASSIGNYLRRSGWRLGEPWGQRVHFPTTLAAGSFNGNAKRSLAEWQSIGIRRVDDRPFSRGDIMGRLLIPDDDTTNAFLVYENFEVIRRYNPSDFYALAVGLLGDQATS